MITLSVDIVAHQKRLAMAEHLASSSNADRLWVDDGTLGEWKNHLRAWRAAEGSGATHAVILQDDAVPVEGFRDAVLQAVELKPGELISLYVGTHRPRREEVLRSVGVADREKASWLVADTLMWGVGIVIPTHLIGEALEEVRTSRLPYDQRIGKWAEDTGRDVYYTWPSLVDHKDEETVVKGRSKSQGVRVAHRVGIPEWNDKAVRINQIDNNFLGSTKDRT